MMKRNKIAALIGGLCLIGGATGAFALAGVGSTGAYLSDTVSATQSSSIAYVGLATPTSSSAAFANLQPETSPGNTANCQSRVIVVTSNGTVPEDVYYKQSVATGLPSQDSTPSQLTVSMSAPSSGLNSSTADVSPQSVLAYYELAPGASFNLTITACLASTAGGTYNAPTNWNQPGLVVTIPIKLVAVQTGLGWMVIN